MRAPQVIEYASATGAAALVSPSGEIVLFSGSAPDVDLARVPRAARLVGGARAPVAFRLGGACVHAGPVRDGWMLCIVALSEVAPTLAAERLRKAAHVLALALVDGVRSGSSGGSPAPAAAGVFAMRKRN
jgi:hypothetical protein